MKKNFNQQMFDIDGEPLFRDEAKKKPMTMATVISNCLLFPQVRGEENLEGFEKARRFTLAQKITQAENDVDVTTEDLALIKDLVGKVSHPIFVGPIYNYIEEKPVKEKKNGDK